MLLTKSSNIKKNYNKGFTLIEIIVVISIIAILCAVIAPTYFKYTKDAKEKVCNVNCLQLERSYNLYLEKENIEHSDVVFEQFLQNQGKNICPEHGYMIYVDEKVQCSVHVGDDVKKENEDEVPFLE
ncbi:prepilin-type N-terminal cleavage/methylation domain-containing protein [Clostridium sp. KNHs214]|uniref:prepilin-type N-terminal cleavage/methylation domain-containing protein n=1 Tax=Clostridium sp. KNHs214 TaxID=1540257 RepID=UPI00068CD578|nr:prepilin-type N-terminal cleavage/methylation domain-containing protein [Clostridium sp. KNHs214]